MTNAYVQYGCGLCAPQTWLNFDSSLTLRLERLPLCGLFLAKRKRLFPDNVYYGDITRGLPVQPNSCNGIYCSHVLEHLALDDFDIALSNSFKYLRRGGTFRFVLPDLERLVKDYLADTSECAAAKFMRNSCLGRKERARGLRGLLVAYLGNTAHLWMWDEKSMRERLCAHGFNEIHRVAFGDAEDKRFSEVEDIGRFDGCLAMQCRK